MIDAKSVNMVEAGQYTVRREDGYADGNCSRLRGRDLFAKEILYLATRPQPVGKALDPRKSEQLWSGGCSSARFGQWEEPKTTKFLRILAVHRVTRLRLFENITGVREVVKWTQRRFAISGMR